MNRNNKLRPKPSQMVKGKPAAPKPRAQFDPAADRLTSHIPIPAPDYLLVRRVPTPATSAKGIHMTEQYREIHQLDIGYVIAAGTRCNEYDPGDIVILSPMDGVQVLLPTGPDLRSEPWVFIRETGVVGLWIPEPQKEQSCSTT